MTRKIVTFFDYYISEYYLKNMYYLSVTYVII